MRTESKEIVADHDLLLGQQSNSHHPPVEVHKVQINYLAISPGAYQHAISLTYPGHKTVRAILRGHENVNIQGHTGCYVLGADVSQQCGGISIKPYGPGGYVTSYMGGYSRLHGDSYLTHQIFGGGISLRDIWIGTSPDQCILEFFNTSGLSRNLTVYGTVLIK
jgi:hypothetical protein